MSPEFMSDWLIRNIELTEKYQPQLFWFDWWIEEAPFAPYLREFAAYYYNRAREWSREVTINHKFGAFPESAAVFDIERGQLDDLRTRFWQTDTSMSRNSWGFISDHNYRDARTILHDLIDITSKNGALLLNVGPRADGTIPEAEATILRRVGDWLAVNGEAIYGTRPWKVFGEGPTDVVGGSFNDDKRTPLLPEENLSSSGFARASEISSFTVRAGSDGCTTSTLVLAANSEIDARSRCVSNDRFL